ncbi:cyclic nucleotide-gated cation channel alpha-3-like [Stylophora pistillata]|uniref:cyclic nucleotide-gated cation channel alpha-3-like n=1 Tax=Stylophora pistillata TaxID=50429 RepID=UPI000C048A8B|nr:cyclic nucleotide-gated cation channel alpha-3-like [Stylophora pistillata]
MSSAKDGQIQVTFKGVSLANEDFNFVPQPPFVVNPRTTFYRFWEAGSAICIFLTCLLVPFQASFDARDVSLWVFVYIFDVLFLADVLLTFRVGYYNKGALVTDKSSVTRRYLRTKFIPDFLTLIPLDLLVFGVQKDLGWYQLLTLLRLNRILRVYRLVSFFGARENELGTNTTLIRALKYAAIGTITIHAMSCVWYSLACANEGATAENQIKNVTPCDPDSWAIALSTGIESVDVWKRYVLSLYWATATATSTGYGDLHAETIGEKWFSIIAMLTGIGLFFGLIFGGMASMLTNLDSRRMRYTHHFDVIKDHLVDMKISADIRSRVLAYYEYLWTHNRGERGDGMFSDLPLTFQAELSLSINKKVLEKAPLFRGLNPGFRRMLSLVIRPVFYMPNQIIANKGDIGHHMFYIHRGRAEILCENGNEVFVTLKEGKLFGEVSMVYNLPRSASVRAATPCIVFLLDRVDLNRVLRHYPTVAEQLYIALEHRCDLKNIGSLVTEAGSKKEDFLEMENEKAKAWLRQSVGFQEDTSNKDSLLTRFSRYVIMPDSWFAVIWERVLLSVLLFICFMYTFVASFSISLHALGFGESVGSKVLMAFTYLLDAVLVTDFIMRFNLASGTTTEIKDIRKCYRKSLLFWIDLLAILPIEIMALLQERHHEKWHLLAILRLNRLIKAVRFESGWRHDYDCEPDRWLIDRCSPLFSEPEILIACFQPP